jgi:hypothetical protein
LDYLIFQSNGEFLNLLIFLLGFAFLLQNIFWFEEKKVTKFLFGTHFRFNVFFTCLFLLLVYDGHRYKYVNVNLKCGNKVKRRVVQKFYLPYTMYAYRYKGKYLFVEDFGLGNDGCFEPKGADKRICEFRIRR